MTTFDAVYSLLLPDGGEDESGACTIAIEGPGLTLTPRGAASIPIRFAEVNGWRAEDYSAELTLADKSAVRISRLAHRFEEFASSFRQARREHFLKALLLEEEIKSFFEQGCYDRIDAGGTTAASGSCSVYLQRTSLACFPDLERPFLLPYGALTAIDRDNDRYRITLAGDDGGQLLLHRFGKQTDNLFDGIEGLRSQLSQRQGEAIAALSPGTGALALRRAGQLLRDGVPVEQTQLETAVPGVWDALWSCGFNEERRPYVEQLRDKGSAAFVVIKETGVWGATEETPTALADRRLLFLFQLGATIAVETPSSEDTATYVFRISGDVADFVRSLCRALASVQFRREPLYLPLSAMNAPPHDRYAEACRLLPDLVAARQAFAGRAIHSSITSWQRELDGIAARRAN